PASQSKARSPAENKPTSASDNASQPTRQVPSASEAKRNSSTSTAGASFPSAECRRTRSSAPNMKLASTNSNSASQSGNIIVTACVLTQMEEIVNGAEEDGAPPPMARHPCPQWVSSSAICG